MTPSYGPLVRRWSSLSAAFLLGLAGCYMHASSAGLGGADLVAFPWPPPEPSVRAELPTALCPKNATSVGQVAADLAQRTAEGGYVEPRFGGVPGGFALLLPPERFEADGRPAAQDRWSTEYPHMSLLTVEGFLALFRGYEAHYRVIVVALSDQPPTGPSAAGEVAVERFVAFRRAAGRILPEGLANQPVSPAHRCYAYIYEYVRESADAEAAKPVRPGSLGADAHLRAAGLYPAP